MKSNLLSLTVAALLGCMPFAASARDTGRAVGAQFDSTILSSPSSFSFEPVSLNNNPLVFGNGKKGPDSVAENECKWQVLNIPVRIGAKKVDVEIGSSKKAMEPNYVPAITFHVYVLIDRKNAVDPFTGRPLDKKKRALVLDKEVTYVNIPLEKAPGTFVGKEKVDVAAKMNVAVFLSPYDVRAILSDASKEFESPKGGKSDPKIDISAVAVTARYSEASCWQRDKGAKEDDVKMSSEVKTWAPENWWRKKPATTCKAQLYSINETPFAAYYYPNYYPTRPLFSVSGSSSSFSSPSSVTPTSALGDPQETTAADAAGDTPGDTAATDTTTTDTPGATSGRKPRKSRSSRN